MLLLLLALAFAPASAAVDCLPADAELIDPSFQLDWRFNAQFAGIFQADAAAYLLKAGVNMTIHQWEDGVNVIEEVAPMDLPYELSRQCSSFLPMGLWHHRMVQRT